MKARLALTVSVAMISGAGGCGESAGFSEPWPGFPEHVIVAANDLSRRANTPVDRPVIEVSATRGSVLSALYQSFDTSEPLRSQAVRRSLYNGDGAFDFVLADIAGDADLPLGVRWRASSAIRGREHVHGPLASSPAFDRAFDAVMRLHDEHPGDFAVGGHALASLVTVDRMEALVRAIERADRTTRESLISAFGTLTHTGWPTTRLFFCGNTSPDTMREATEAAHKRQAAAVADIRAWWEEHRDEPYERRVVDRLDVLFEFVLEHAAVYEDPDGMYGFTDDVRRMQVRDALTPYGRSASSLGEDARPLLWSRWEQGSDYERAFALLLLADLGGEREYYLVAEQLRDGTPNTRYAALEAIERFEIEHLYDEAVVCLDASFDRDIRMAAMSLVRYRGSPACIPVLIGFEDDDEIGRDVGYALRRFAAEHRDAVDRLVYEATDEVEQAILLEAISRADRSSPGAGGVTGNAARASELERVRGLLRSDDLDDVNAGVKMVGDRALVELLPEVIRVFLEFDESERTNDAWGWSPLRRYGVPGLTPERAMVLAGRDMELDLAMAEYCYGKFGEESLPLLRRVFFESLDGRKLESKRRVPGEAVGLVRVLFELGVPMEEVERELVVKARAMPEYRSRLAPLLAEVVGASSATLLGEMLDDRWSHRFAVADAIARRGLVGSSDKLFAGRFVGPLAELGDPRAIDAAVERVASYSGSRMLSLEPSPSQLVYELEALRPAHDGLLRERLREAIASVDRRIEVELLTSVLAIAPAEADREVFAEVLRGAEAAAEYRETRLAAAVGLSKLNDRRGLDTLRKLGREAIASAGLPAALSQEVVHAGSSLSWWDQERPGAATWREVGDRRAARRVLEPRMYGRRWSIGLALARLGDDSLVDEAIAGLRLPGGQINAPAFEIAACGLGSEAGPRLEEALKRDPAVALASTRLWRHGVELGIHPDDVLDAVPNGSLDLVAGSLVGLESPPAGLADRLAASIAAERPRLHGDSRSKLMNALCRLDPERCVEVAGDDGMLLRVASAWHEAAPPMRSWLEDDSMKLNHIEDGLEWRRRSAEEPVSDRSE